MTNLVELLKSETETLKVQYLQMTENWAVTNFESMKKSDFLYLYKGTTYHKNRHGSTKSEDAMFNKVANTLNKGFDAYLTGLIKDANDHYDSSIQKLAFRIESKGLNQELLKVETSHIGVNIETTLTDGNKTVRAFTIIAGGEIQRPHYRYLIK